MEEAENHWKEVVEKLGKKGKKLLVREQMIEKNPKKVLTNVGRELQS